MVFLLGSIVSRLKMYWALWFSSWALWVPDEECIGPYGFLLDPIVEWCCVVCCVLCVVRCVLCVVYCVLCVVLCYVVLCCVMLCCVVFVCCVSCVVLCCAVLCCAVLCCVLLFCRRCSICMLTRENFWLGFRWDQSQRNKAYLVRNSTWRNKTWSPRGLLLHDRKVTPQTTTIWFPS